MAQLGMAYTLDLGSTGSLKSVASSMTDDMMSFYEGHKPGGTPGLLPLPYYWWEAGALMGALVDYWYYTGDTKWNEITQEGLLFQVGPNNDYMPPNQTRTEGNDDQGFWGMAAMTAAEYKFQNPPDDKQQWLALAQAVFNTQAARWDETECGGGLRWQIFTWNNGYDYKNSISQACFFNIAARLARYTGNQSYAEWADKTWDWMEATKLLQPETYYVFDGAHTTNCSDITPYQWTYNAGAFLLGAAAMYNCSTGRAQEVWRERVDGLLNGTMVFFTGDNSDVMTEVACEPVNMCDLDQQSFKAYLSRWMAATTKWAPWTYRRIKPLLAASATAAASTCTGGANGRMCGLKWTNHSRFDGSMGVGQQMAAMEVVLANMIEGAPAPVTEKSGGTSTGDPGAGGSDMGRTDPFSVAAVTPVSTAGKAGAYILTILAILGLLAGCGFVLMEEDKNASALEGFSGFHSVAHTHRRGQGRDKGKGIDSDDSSGGSPGTPEKYNMVIKSHEDSLPEDEIFASTPRRPRPRPRSTQSDTSSYWTTEYHHSPSGGREQRLSYPRADRRTEALRKKALNNSRSVRWRETKRYV